MEEKECFETKRINYYKEIIKDLRNEISELIKENGLLKERVIDLETINKGHQELVGYLIEENKGFKNEKVQK